MQNTVCPERKTKNENSGSEDKLSKNVDGKTKAKPIANKLKDCTNNGKKDCTRKNPDVDLISLVSIPDRKLFQPKEKSTNILHAECKDEGKHKFSVANKHGSKMSIKGKKSFSKEKRGKKDKIRKEKAVDMEKNPEGDDFEMPSMSFEEYLSYDLEAPKRKKRLCESKNPKRIKVDQREDVKMHDSSTKLAQTTVVNSIINYLSF